MWKDIDANFTRNITTDDVETVSDNDAIEQSMANCALIIQGQNLRDLDFGPDIDGYRQKFMSGSLMDAMRNDIQLTFENYEPRVQIIGINMTANKNFRLTVQVQYVIKAFGSQKVFTVQFFIDRLM